ncbi:DUF2911 domain-containing protein [Hyphobacterium sp. CCMP332]|nr:DUF2911 domain-containing protein [Hyphobacterium sp. CCMP332]
MIKKILIGLGILVILLAAFILSYFFYFTRLASPEANLHFENQEVQLDINYCQPGKKSRLIFGNEGEGALVPFGKYWRLGANQATEIEFKQAVLFNDVKVEAGKYRMYAIPNKDFWIIRLNSQLGEWGAIEPDYSLDVAETKVPTISTEETELFTMTIKEKQNGALLIMKWDRTSVEIPLQSIIK